MLGLPECQHRRYTTVPGAEQLYCFLKRAKCSEEECLACEYAAPEGGEIVEIERCDGSIEIGRIYHGINPALDKFGHKTGPWTVDKPSRGLGDTIAKFTHTTGIDAVVKAVTRRIKIPCGCLKRQEALNKLVPYKEK